MEPFSGDGSQKFDVWAKQFEETAQLCDWTEVHKLINAKRLLRDLRSFLQTSNAKQADTWRKLRKALSAEFQGMTNSKMVHQQLSQLKKKANETYQEFVYRTLDIASHAEIEIEAKIQYIIEGIQDDEANKAILYGATSIKELRKKLVDYETITNRRKARTEKNNDRHQTTATTDRPAQSSNATIKKKCFNCGYQQHTGRDCPHQTGGTKCFACGMFGHIANNCRARNNATAPTREARCEQLNANNNKLYKRLKIMGREIAAVIDSGSDLVRSSTFQLLH